MTRRPRPGFRSSFVLPSRHIRLHFYTSNLPKYLQAKVVLEKFGVSLTHFRSRTEPYSEDYSAGTEVLLSRAIAEVKRSVGSASLFMVEDTSLRIEALSGSGSDFPGLGVKEWFEHISFQDLDEQLKRRGNDRRATVKSDIALHVPALERVVFFHGETLGEVAPAPPTFLESAQYPWLTPASFNGWFIPTGSSRTLGEMSFEESWNYDFRIASLCLLVDRLEEYAATLNLPASAYSRVSEVPASGQLSLLGGLPPLLIAIGRMCAGKTTLGEFCSQRFGLRPIEASSVVRLLSPGVHDGPEGAFENAQSVLKERGPDIVAKNISSVFQDALRNGAVITGFRTIEEVALIRHLHPHARAVWVDASERTRFHRHLSRGRGQGDYSSIATFRMLDRQQEEFGLLRVGRILADIEINNEGSMVEFHQKIAAALQTSLGPDAVRKARRAARTRQRNQLYRCLRVLELTSGALSSAEISRILGGSGTPILPNNVNKVLRSAGALVTRREEGNSEITYELRDAGVAFMRLLEQARQPRIET